MRRWNSTLECHSPLRQWETFAGGHRLALTHGMACSMLLALAQDACAPVPGTTCSTPPLATVLRGAVLASHLVLAQDTAKTASVSMSTRQLAVAVGVLPRVVLVPRKPISNLSWCGSTAGVS